MPKVLLIEDDQTMLSLLSTLLQLEGFQVTKVVDDTIVDIYQRIQNEQPDAVLLDVNLRNVNGLDLLKEVRANPAMNHIRFLMSSGIDYKEQCLNNGADGFILKPYMPDELITLIRNNQTQSPVNRLETPKT